MTIAFYLAAAVAVVATVAGHHPPERGARPALPRRLAAGGGVIFYHPGRAFCRRPGGDHLCRRDHGAVRLRRDDAQPRRAAGEQRARTGSPRESGSGPALLGGHSAGRTGLYPRPGDGAVVQPRHRSDAEAGGRRPVRPLPAGRRAGFHAAAGGAGWCLPPGPAAASGRSDTEGRTDDATSRLHPRRSDRGGRPFRARADRRADAAQPDLHADVMEIMLNAAGLAFVAPASRWVQPDGQIMFILILAVAAAEVAVGLALVLRIYPHFGTLDADARERQDARLTCSNLIWLIPALPFAGFLILFAGAVARCPRAAVAAIGVGAWVCRRCVAVADRRSASSWSLPAGGAYIAAALGLADGGRLRAHHRPLPGCARGGDDPGGDHCRLSHPPVFGRVHGRGRGLQPLFRLHESVRRLHADPGAGGQPARCSISAGRAWACAAIC